MEPKTSVVMSVYNGERYLREAVDSILNQTFRDFEFLIVNDGSTDGTEKILRCYRDFRIKIVNNERNIGLTKSLNKGLKLAKGEYIARQDADDISLPQRLEKQVKFLDTHRHVALIGSPFLVINEDGKILGVQTVLLLNEEIQKRLLKDNAFGHGTSMFRKDCLDKIGLYREEFKSAQDYDLWLRISERYNVANIAEPLYKWRISLSSVSVKGKVIQDKYTEFARELARERKEYGKDKLQTLSKEKIGKILEGMTQEGESGNGLIIGYYFWGRFFYSNNDYKNTFRCLIRLFPCHLFNRDILVLILKTVCKIVIPKRLWFILKQMFNKCQK